MKMLDKALFLVTAGNTLQRLEQFGLLNAMKTVMLGDRLFNRTKHSDFVVFDGMSKKLPSREANWHKHLATAYAKGKTLFTTTEEIS